MRELMNGFFVKFDKMKPFTCHYEENCYSNKNIFVRHDSNLFIAKVKISEVTSFDASEIYKTSAIISIFL